jgi:hypothetical protein
MIGVSWDKEIRGVNLKPEQFYDYFEESVLVKHYLAHLF